MKIVVTIDEGTCERDVELIGTTWTSFGELLPHLRAKTGVTGDAFWSGSHRLFPENRLGGPGLLPGSRLTTAICDTRVRGEEAVASLDVVGGPHAGCTYPITSTADLLIGRDDGCALRLDDASVSRRHAIVHAGHEGVQIRDLGSRNGCWADTGRTKSTIMRAAAHFSIGESVLAIADPSGPPASIERQPFGTIAVTRSPRFPSSSPRTLTPPPGATKVARRRLPWAAVVLPIATAVPIALLTHSMEFLAFALMSPALSLGVGLNEHRGPGLHRIVRRRALRRAFRHEVDSELMSERSDRRRADPDPCALARIIAGPTDRLWERDPTDPDFLRLRIGLADQPSLTRIDLGDGAKPAGRLRSVPATVALTDGALGLTGHVATARRAAAWAVCQLAALHSPADVSILLVADDRAARAWRWTRWLPHVVRARAEEYISELCAALPQQPNSPVSAPTRNAAHVVLVVDSCPTTLRTPVELLIRGHSGVGVICVGEQSLSPSCRQHIRINGDLFTRADLRIPGNDGSKQHVLEGILLDQVGDGWCDRFSRALAGVDDATRPDSTGLPESVRLLELFSPDALAPHQISATWQSAPSLSPPMAATSAGPFTLDLVRDGPHILVAGMTGAGKSELLRTMICALALTNAPTDVSFLLVDYKGGAAFAECAELPHSTGMMTDLDPHSTHRALISLDAEIRRRERAFAELRVSDLDAYRRARRESSEELGRLLIVIDEFAALVEEQPDFMSGLVSLAQRGRSLGIHLVLATQRPSGVVSSDIKANVGATIALRVADALDSLDVLGVRDAAKIDRQLPGRALVRIGSDLIEVQTACVHESASTSHPTGVLVLDDWRQSAAVAPMDRGTGGPTDIQSIVEAISRTYRDGQWTAPRRPWSAPLPERLDLTAIAEGTGDLSTGPLIGLIDRPEQQCHHALVLDSDAGLAVFGGAPGSGRSTALITTARAVMAAIGEPAVDVHLLDFAGGTLLSTASSWGCIGTALDRSSLDAVATFLRRLLASTIRRALLAPVAGRPPGRGDSPPPPHTLLLIDGWDQCASALDQHPAAWSVLVDLVRSARQTGIKIAVAGSRSVLTHGLLSDAADRFALHLTDRSDYVLAGLDQRAVPDTMPPGRAVRLADGAVCQLGRSRPDDLPPVFAGNHAANDRVVVRALRSDPAQSPGVGRTSPGSLLIGVGGDLSEPVEVNLRSGTRRFLIGGPAGSGRSTLMTSLLRQAAAQCLDVEVVATRGPLATAARELGVTTHPPSGTLTSHRGGLLLVDDVEDLLDAPLLAFLDEVAADESAAGGLVVAVRTDEMRAWHSALVARMRRARTGILLAPRPTDGELLGVRLPPILDPTRAGRGYLVSQDPVHQQGVAGEAVIPVLVTP
ncbi:MAG: FHA domain-containing protein [Actinobacteria bacterium]|nr:FHA domain-containing protein [Actinomycetota bacterium]